MHATASPRPSTLRRPVLTLAIAAAFGLCAVSSAQAQVSVDVGVTASAPGWLYDLGSVISVFVDPPVYEPEPVAVAWAPPPMLVEDVPPQPGPDYVWTGGYWTWQGDWVWCAGQWAPPPQPAYVWVQPYYEHRDDRVIFIPGYWSDPNAEFVAPPVDRPIPWAFVSAGVVIGPPPMGPAGIFVPPPPGSRPGIIVPAPIGTPPAVVISAPPVLAVGMRISGSVTIDARNTVINDNRVTNYRVTNVRNITNVTVQAPASAMASGRAFQAQVPHQAHLAAAMHPVVAARAPMPASRTAVPSYAPGRTLASLPPPQHVQGLPAVPSHGAANVSQAQGAQMGHAPLTPTQARQQAHAAPRSTEARGGDQQRVPAPVNGNERPASGERSAATPSADSQRAEMQAQQQRDAQAQQQRAAQERNQQAQQQRAAQVQAQQRAQQEQQRDAQQRAQQEQSQRNQQQEQQRAAQAQAQQRVQQQEQQHPAQERAQPQPQAQQRGRPEDARGQPERPQEAREHPAPREGEGKQPPSERE